MPRKDLNILPFMPEIVFVCSKTKNDNDYIGLCIPDKVLDEIGWNDYDGLEAAVVDGVLTIKKVGQV